MTYDRKLFNRRLSPQEDVHVSIRGDTTARPEARTRAEAQIRKSAALKASSSPNRIPARAAGPTKLSPLGAESR